MLRVSAASGGRSGAESTDTDWTNEKREKGEVKGHSSFWHPSKFKWKKKTPAVFSLQLGDVFLLHCITAWLLACYYTAPAASTQSYRNRPHGSLQDLTWPQLCDIIHIRQRRRCLAVSLDQADSSGARTSPRVSHDEAHKSSEKLQRRS